MNKHKKNNKVEDKNEEKDILGLYEIPIETKPIRGTFCKAQRMRSTKSFNTPGPGSYNLEKTIRCKKRNYTFIEEAPCIME